MTPQYDGETLKKAQEASLEILLAVDRICRANGIRYLMDAGTLLGAVRHGGFIPWDDDIDIAMTRENYEALKRLLRSGKNLLPDNMEFILPDEYRNGRAFYDFTPRIIYKNSRRHGDSREMDYYEGKLNHLWVDIFILDNLPDDPFLDRWTRFCQKVIYGLSMPKRYRLELAKYSGMDRLRVAALSAAGRFFSMRRLFALQERLSRKYEKKHTRRLYYSNYQPDYLHDTLNREWSEQVTELTFEGHQLMAPAGFEEVLQEIYGDYMQLPPEESRVPSHSDGLEVF